MEFVSPVAESKNIFPGIEEASIIYPARVGTYYRQGRQEKNGRRCLQVLFTRQGWEHITGRDDKKRTAGDVYRRLKLLPHARGIISKMPLVQNKRRKGNNTFYALEAMIDIKDGDKVSERKIRVVLKEDKVGAVRFFSIMDKKQKK